MPLFVPGRRQGFRGLPGRHNLTLPAAAAGSKLVIARRQHIPLILCCADDGEVALVGVLDELYRKGFVFEVLMGVDVDVVMFINVVDC